MDDFARSLFSRPAFLLASSVGDGPIQRLVDHLSERGIAARLTHWFSGQQWREMMGRGRIGRIRARLESYFGYPLATVLRTALESPAVVVPSTNPFTLPFALVATRKLHRRPVVATVWDLYPDAIEASGLATASSPLARIAAAMNRYWFRHIDGIVFIGEQMGRNAVARYGEPRVWRVIEIGCDTRDFVPERIGPAAAENELERWCDGRTIFSYVGNMGLMHDWETLAEAVPTFLERFAERKGSTRDVGVVIAAFGPGVERLKQAWAGRIDERRVRFVPPLDDRAWGRLMVRSDISLVTLRSEAVHSCVPSKALSAMAAGSALVVVAPGEADLSKIVREHECGEVVEPGDVDRLTQIFERLASDDLHRTRLRKHALEAAQEHYDMPRIAARWEAFLAELGLDVRRPGRLRKHGLSARLKRALDLTGALAGLAVTGPIMAAAAVAIALDMGRPVLFKQERAGLEGKPFTLYKFRTMKPAPADAGPESDAMRLTRLGRMLRATSIDELPAIFNVLKGEMSLVGPRPLLMRYLERYDSRQRRRHEVLPGITGWAQINGRNAIRWEEKFEHDVWYVDNRSLLLDLWIIAQTALKVVRRSDISHEGHVSMPEFMGSSTRCVVRDS